MALFMKEQVVVRKQEIQENTRKDAFSLLVKANEQEELKYQLSDDELVDIVFISHMFSTYTSSTIDWEYLYHAVCGPWCVL